MLAGLLLILQIVAQIAAFHFYLEGQQPTCFIEDLYHGATVLGKFTALDFNENLQAWAENAEIGVQIEVTVSYTLTLEEAVN